MWKLTTHEVQKIEYDILVAFDQFCEANHLTYMLAGGTLLGAIRHHGFIPWDDDIDVIMPRNDYDRLLQLPKTVIGNEQKKYEIWHWKNSGSHYPFIKIVDPDTYVKTDYIRQEREIPHIWIDVFPLDGNPNDRVKTEKLYKKVARYRRILSLRNANPWEGRTWYVRITKPFVVGLLQVLPNHFLCSKMDSISKTYSYQTSTYVGGVLWGYGARESMDKKVFQEQKKVAFEQGNFPVPVGYQIYLSRLYGKYMVLPPKEKRITHILDAYLREN